MDPELVGNVRAALRKHTAWLELALSDLQALESDITATKEDLIAARTALQARHIAESARIETEVASLMHIWQTAAVSEEERQSVRIMAARAATLAEELAAAMERGRQWCESERDAVGTAIGQLRTTRNHLIKYRFPDPAVNGGIMDHHA